jgi:hypothetical protein
MNWEGFGRKRQLTTQGIAEIHEKSQDNRHPVRDSNQAPPKYESTVLPLCQRALFVVYLTKLSRTQTLLRGMTRWWSMNWKAWERMWSWTDFKVLSWQLCSESKESDYFPRQNQPICPCYNVTVCSYEIGLNWWILITLNSCFKWLISWTRGKKRASENKYIWSYDLNKMRHVCT